jgi:hypothetical protein
VCRKTLQEREREGKGARPFQLPLPPSMTDRPARSREIRKKCMCLTHCLGASCFGFCFPQIKKKEKHTGRRPAVPGTPTLLLLMRPAGPSPAAAAASYAACFPLCAARRPQPHRPIPHFHRLWLFGFLSRKGEVRQGCPKRKLSPGIRQRLPPAPGQNMQFVRFLWPFSSPTKLLH